MTTPADPAGFSADWLRLREPFDRAARAAAAPRLGLARHWAALPAATASAPRRVLDLACGSGATLRALAPRLGPHQHWLLVDHDPALLAHLPQALAAWAGAAGHRLDTDGERWWLRGRGFDARIESRRLDLARELDALPFEGLSLLTASALLDLVSAAWLARLVAACSRARVAACLALSVDGRTEWTPADPDDGRVDAHFQAHQRRDKGFGPALGPQAPTAAARAFRAAGCQVRRARSDWLLDACREPASLALQQALIEGIAAAALEQAPDDAARVRAWQARRRQLAPRSCLRIGHADLLVLPPGG